MNIQTNIATIFFIIIPSLVGFSQEKPTSSWNLKDCIDYARKNNIQVQSAKVTQQNAYIDLLQAKAQLFPSLTFSSSQNWGHQKTEQSDGKFKSQSAYTGNYTLNGGLTIYNGGKLTRSIRQQQMTNSAQEYQVNMAENDIEIAVTEAYLQILYANESLKTNRQTLETSAAQLARSKELLAAGSIAASDYAQIEAQYSNDLYNVTMAENTLTLNKLQLKQLLELEPTDSFDVYFPELEDTQVLTPAPSLLEVYQIALETMPEMKNSQLNVESAQLEEKIAAGDRLPSISLSASVATNHDSESNHSFSKQLNNRLNENVGINISIPISKNRQIKSAVEKAKLQTETARLEELNTRKELWKTVETLHQNVLSAQSRYVAATNSVKSASMSYNLVQEQFNAGMKNTVELLTEKNNYLSALQEQIQAKFEAILSLKLLNFYRNQPIEI
ncbi:MAG: TolC family protein [Butyricimonas virosa]|jgi:outer membrane efflux protein|uniref:TolC family protein n=1 Tax=Butyricimonas virosa TaxID=544645 RepID=UPI0022E25725|nr:TolC family protein [Butyricimonas virosa]MCI7391236.1 TolC family protein [Butyricimonas virosa]MDY4906611.1 TolC family protein [Butyricimonas virosa]MDY5489551.1 TolC family protein [Butyricimonas virosa]MDY5532085.1 TolC family protein [Butyricimonas virosa]